MVYLDYCATTPLDDRVADLMDSVEREVYGNPSSIHRLGQNARAKVEVARRQVAAAIGAEPSEIIFTGSGSEASNIVLWDVFQREGKHIVLSAVEHPCVINTARAVARLGVEVTEIAVDSTGRVELSDVVDNIRPDTALVTIMTANNETGTVQPVEGIGEICREKGVRFHSDAVQALGKIEIDYITDGPNTAGFSAHKIYGPKGVGALYVQKGVKLHPLVYGGGQEQTLRAGTENVAGIAGFGLAAEIAIGKISDETPRLEGLRERISVEFPSAFIYGHEEHHLPGVLTIGFPGVDGQNLLMKLDLDGFAVSTGSACSSGTTKSSSTLKAMGLSDDECQSVLRISPGRFTTESDVEAFLASLLSHVHDNSAVEAMA